MNVGVLTRDRTARRADPADPIDPRLRARRDEVARDHRGRRLRRLLAVLLVLVMAGAAVGVTHSSLLDIDRITVRGTTHTSAVEIRRASGLRHGQPMLWVDAARAARRVERLPWVRSARVARHWPGTLTVSVTERVPVAIAGRGRSAAVVDVDGRVLGPVTDRVRRPTLAEQPGPAGSELGAAGRRLVRILADVPGALRVQIRTARTSADGILLTLRDGIVVRWGDATQTGPKADAVGALLRQADRATIATIDVSVPTAAALTRRDGSRN